MGLNNIGCASSNSSDEDAGMLTESDNGTDTEAEHTDTNTASEDEDETDIDDNPASDDDTDTTGDEDTSTAVPGSDDSDSQSEDDSVPSDGDADGDGLSDADEVNIWHTSPLVADSDGDGFSDFVEIMELAFDPEVNNYQFNPLIPDRPKFDIELTQAPLIYATYTTLDGSTTSIGQERSDETRHASTRSWGGSNSVAVEQSHSGGASVGFEKGKDGKTKFWKPTIQLSYEFSYSSTKETTSEWSTDQTTENAKTLTDIETFEESNEISSSGGVLAISIRVSNPGDIAYFLDNLTLSAYELNPENPEQISPIGTLTLLDSADTFPRTRLDPGEVSPYLSFQADLDLPTVKALLENSRNLMIAPATWLIEGDGRVDFELAATAINARTAEVIIDYGMDIEPETYRVSTVNHEGRNYITVEEALSDILKIPFTQGSVPFRRSPDSDPVDTENGLLSIRDYATVDADATLWNVVHSYPVDNGADTRIDQYHPFVNAVDFGALKLQKGHTLHLVRIVDVDRDGLGERSEYALGTDPLRADTDDDGCVDGLEVFGWDVGEGDELVHYRSDPLLPNTDFDRYTDCEEFHNGSDPTDPDSIPPEVFVEAIASDGIVATLTVAFSDPDGPVMEIRYSVDDGEETRIDVSANTTGTVDIPITFTTGGTHAVRVTAVDGNFLSEPAVVSYDVAAPTDGLTHYYPIEGEYSSPFADSIGDADAAAETMSLVTGRDGRAQSAGRTYVDNERPAGLINTPEDVLTPAFSVSLWIDLSADSNGILLGQYGSFMVEGSSNTLSLYELNTFDNNSGSGDQGETMTLIGSGSVGPADDVNRGFHLLTVIVAGGIGSLYLNDTMLFEAPISTVGGSCGVVFGQPGMIDKVGDVFNCSGTPAPSDPDDPRVDVVFDDIRIYSRALSANEVTAIYWD
jgi:hypothetical protein